MKNTVLFIFLLFATLANGQTPIISPTVIAPAGSGGALSNGWFVEYTIGESYVSMPTDSMGIGFRHGIPSDTATPRVDFRLASSTSIFEPNNPITITATLANAKIETWFIKNANVTGSKTDKNIHIQFTDTGSYDVALVFLTPWGSTDTVLKKQFIQIVRLVPQDTIICPTNEIKFQVLGPKMKEYVWNIGNGQSTLISHPATTTEYRVRLTAQNGDTLQLSSTIHVIQPISLGIDLYKCATAPVTIDAGVHEKYIWSNGSTTQSIEATELGIYSVTVTDVACTSSDEIAVMPNPYENKIPFNIGGDSTVCEGSNELYTIVDTSHTLAKYKWSLISSDNKTNTIVGGDSLISFQIAWNTMGIDTVTVRRIEQNGCESKKSKFVKISPKPEVSFSINQETDDDYIFENKSTQPPLVDNGFSEILSTNYNWWFVFQDDTVKKITNDKLVAKTLPLGVNTIGLRGTNFYGCTAIHEETITVEISMALYVPNVFNPGNNNENIAQFQPKGCNLKEYLFEVYDSWGNLLWTTNKLMDGKIAEGWDGMYNGSPMKSDTYIWMMEATFENYMPWKGIKQRDGSYSKSGNFLLLRQN